MKRKQLLILFILSIVLLSGCVQEYAVNAEILPKNAGEVKGDKTYQSGQKVKLEVTSKENYEFVGWEKDGEIVNKNNTYEFEIKKDVDLVAKFNKKEYQLDIEVNDKEMGKTKGSGKYLPNEEIDIEAIPNEDYEFVGWYNQEDELISKKENYNLKIKSDLTLIARFKEEEFSVELDKNIEDGELFGEGSYIEGDKQYIRAEIVPGYEFKYWEDEEGNIFSEKMGKMLTVNKDYNLTAIYEKKDQNFYLDYSEDEIKAIAKRSFALYFGDDEARYFMVSKGVFIKELQDQLSNGDYSIIHYPGLGYFNLILSDDITLNSLNYNVKNITTENDVIIVESEIIAPIIKVKDIEVLKKQFKRNVIKKYEENKGISLRDTFNELITINDANKTKYTKKIKMKEIKGELKVIEMDKPGELFSSLDELYKAIVVNQIENIDIMIHERGDNLYKVNLDGTILETIDKKDILDPYYLVNKINLKTNDAKKIVFDKFYTELSNHLRDNNYNFYKHKIFDNLEFSYDNEENYIKYSSGFGVPPGGSMYHIIGIIDLDTDQMIFSEPFDGKSTINNIYYSPNNKYIAYNYRSIVGFNKIEIYNCVNKKTIEVIPNYLSGSIKNEFFKSLEILLNDIKWSTNSNELFFKLVDGEHKKGEGMKPIENGDKHSFKFNVIENKLIEVE